MTKDFAASVRARLLNIAKAQDVDFNQILVRFAQRCGTAGPNGSLEWLFRIVSRRAFEVRQI